jgi:glutaredoxin
LYALASRFGRLSRPALPRGARRGVRRVVFSFAMAPRVTLYTRPGCCLCDAAREQLRRARRQAEFDLEEIDIDKDPLLRALYNDEIPVIAINGQKAFRHRVEERAFLKKLKERP